MRPGPGPFVSAYFFLLEFKFDEKLLGGGGGSDGGGSGDGDGGSGTDPHPSHHPPTPSLRWRRATVGAGWGAAAAAGGGLAGGRASQSVRRRVPVAGKAWVAPREPDTPPPSRGHVHARADARTVTFDYNCVTVRRPRVYIKLSIAISIVLDSGVSLGCSPPPRKGVRGRVHRPPSVPGAFLHGGTPKSRT